METDDIELKGDAIESFERVETIEEIILIGKSGGFRRIIIKDRNDFKNKIKALIRNAGRSNMISKAELEGIIHEEE